MKTQHKIREISEPGLYSVCIYDSGRETETRFQIVSRYPSSRFDGHGAEWKTTYAYRATHKTASAFAERRAIEILKKIQSCAK